MQSHSYPQQQWVPAPQVQQQTYQVQGAPPQNMAQGTVQQPQRPGFDHDSQFRCGVLQIVAGCIVFAVAIIMFPLKAAMYNSGYGIWTAPFFLIPGALAVHSAKTKNTCPIVGCMVMSIFAILAAVVVIGFGAGGLNQDNLFNNECKDYHKRKKDFYHTNFICEIFEDTRPESQAQLDARIALNAINIIVGVVEFIVAIVQSAFCCRATCCGGRKQPAQVIVYQSPPVGQGQVPYSPQQPVYPAQQPYGGVPMQPQQQYPMQPQQQYPMQPHQQYPMQTQQAPMAAAPPPMNPDFSAHAAQPSAPPSYDDVVQPVPYKQ